MTITITATAHPHTRRPSTPFCKALYCMIQEHPDAIQWDPVTASLIIYDHPQNLEKTLLPLYFRHHHRFAYFQRQLNNFGYHRTGSNLSAAGKKILYRRRVSGAAKCQTAVESSSISSAASTLLMLKNRRVNLQ